MPFDRLLHILSPPRCAACDRHLARDAVLCAACVTTLEPPPVLPMWVTASFAFGGALAQAIRRMKYGSRPDLLRPLGRAIVEGLPQRRFDVVAPAPLHHARLRARGFDQAALLAAAVARSLGARCDHALLDRVIDTPHLASLDLEARRLHVRGAFTARRVIRGRVLLIDDVYTTGATLADARRAVEEAGGEAHAHVLAATPRE